MLLKWNLMTTAPAIARYTPEDLLHLDGDSLCELVDGQLVEKQMSFLAGKTAVRIAHRLMAHVEKIDAGEVVSEVSFQCFPDNPEQVRRPDIAFVTAERAAGIPPEGHVRIAPDIVIEVISPGDRINDFEEKLSDYRSAGVKLVWEVNPTFRSIRIHRLDRTIITLEENDTLTGEDVLPEFSDQVKNLMPPRSTKSRAVGSI